MHAVTQDISNAIPLSPVTNDAARLKLVRKLVDLVVLPAAKLSNNERDFVADMLIQTVEYVPVEVRLEAANRLAGSGDIPPQLQRTFLLDDFEISSVMLEKVSQIPESILLEVVNLGPDYREAVAIRDDLTSVVVDALLSHGELPVDLIILRKLDLAISGVAVDRLVGRSYVEKQLLTPLLKRVELRLDHGLRMFWWLDTEARKTILSRFATDRSIIQEAMHSLFVEIFTDDNPDLMIKSILTLIDRRHRPRNVDGEAVSMEVVHETIFAALETPTPEFAKRVGLLAGVSEVTGQRVLDDISGEAFAILCKSIGLSRRSFVKILESASTDQRVIMRFDADKQEDLLGVFDSIARDYSRTILRYWDWKRDNISASLSDTNSLETSFGTL